MGCGAHAAHHVVFNIDQNTSTALTLRNPIHKSLHKRVQQKQQQQQPPQNQFDRRSSAQSETRTLPNTTHTRIYSIYAPHSIIYPQLYAMDTIYYSAQSHSQKPSSDGDDDDDDVGTCLAGPIKHVFTLAIVRSVALCARE